MSNAQELANALVETGHAEPEDIEGCSEEEIREIEERFSTVLPAAYKDFLRVMGHCAGYWEDESLWYWQELPEIRANAEYLLKKAADEQKTKFQFSDQCFFFLQRDNDDDDSGSPEILFFDTGTSDDPPVYAFQFRDEPQLVSASFSAWLFDYKEQLLEIQSLEAT